MPLLTREELEDEWYTRAKEAGVDLETFHIEFRYSDWGSRYPVYVRNPGEFCFAEKDGHQCSKPLGHEGSHMKGLYWT